MTDDDLTEEEIEAVRKSREEIKNGNFKRYTLEEMLEELKSRD